MRVRVRAYARGHTHFKLARFFFTSLNANRLTITFIHFVCFCFLLSFRLSE